MTNNTLPIPLNVHSEQRYALRSTRTGFNSSNAFAMLKRFRYSTLAFWQKNRNIALSPTEEIDKHFPSGVDTSTIGPKKDGTTIFSVNVIRTTLVPNHKYCTIVMTFHCWSSSSRLVTVLIRSQPKKSDSPFLMNASRPSSIFSPPGPLISMAMPAASGLSASRARAKATSSRCKPPSARAHPHLVGRHIPGSCR